MWNFPIGMDSPAILDALLCPAFFQKAGIRALVRFRTTCKRINAHLDMNKVMQHLCGHVVISRDQFRQIFHFNFFDLPKDIGLHNQTLPFPVAYDGYQRALKRRKGNILKRVQQAHRRLERFKASRIIIERERRKWVVEVFMHNKIIPVGPLFEKVVEECRICSLDWAHQIMRAWGLAMPRPLSK